MNIEIGSNFWLDPDEKFANKSLGEPSQFNCNGSDYVWLSIGRSAIKKVIQTIEERQPNIKKTAVLPSFTCDTVFKPFIEAGYEIYYYPIDRDLRTSSDTILRTVFANDASIVLFHRYFGFDTLDKFVDRLCAELNDKGIFSIEDCTQNLYSNIHRSKADFFVGSIRKWTGTPDGGFAVCREGKFANKPENSDNELEKAKIKASYAKYNYLFKHIGDKAEMLAMYQSAEEILDHQEFFYKISDTSKNIQANLDKEELVKKRRRNFAILHQALPRQVKSVFGEPLEDVVPLYFPIMVDNRFLLQRHLAQNAVYAPIVWPKDESQPIQCDGAEYAYEHLLCIPIDQRYDEDDMNRIIEVINIFYNK